VASGGFKGAAAIVLDAARCLRTNAGQPVLTPPCYSI
jgi:hypothetical protein